jgi:hypothetical protein
MERLLDFFQFYYFSGKFFIQLEADFMRKETNLATELSGLIKENVSLLKKLAL